MTLIRTSLDLAIPETIYLAIPSAKKQAFRDAILERKALAVKINEGKVNQEITVRAVWHKCHHDEGLSCEPEQEI